MTEKMLGRISAAKFGFGGYQDAMIGLSLTFQGDGWGSATFEGSWSSPPSTHAKWSVAEQEAQWVKAVRVLLDTLTASKKDHVAQLVGVPVEVTFDSPLGRLQSWRVLTEVVA